MRRGAYRRRRPVPALIILAVLLVAAGIVWGEVFRHAGNLDSLIACPAPAPLQAPMPNATPVGYSGLDGTAPVPAQQARVRVFNGTTQLGLAVRVDAELRQFGFAQAGPPSDDSWYPHGDLRCVGQLRFGPAGASAARTLSLLVPCAQLVRDDRQDSTVDLALGTNFSDLAATPDARAVLDRLSGWARQHRQQAVAAQSSDTLGPNIPPALLAGAHSGRC